MPESTETSKAREFLAELVASLTSHLTGRDTGSEEADRFPWASMKGIGHGG